MGTTATETAQPAALDAEQLALINTCKEAKRTRDVALADAQTNFSEAVRVANEEFAAVAEKARKRVKINKLADAIGINRQNLHRLLKDFGGGH